MNQYYAIKAPAQGRIFEETIRFEKEMSIRQFISGFGAKGELSSKHKVWKDAYRQGYRCVKVEIKEIV